MSRIGWGVTAVLVLLLVAAILLISVSLSLAQENGGTVYLPVISAIVGGPTATATSIAVPGAPVTKTVNMPMLDWPEDANDRAIFWAGQVSPTGNYFDVRLQGYAEGIIVRVQIIDLLAEPDDTFRLAIAEFEKNVTYGQPDDWTVEYRGSEGDFRGWTIDGEIPWSAFGGRPSDGTVWPMQATLEDLDTGIASWAGQLHIGLPDYGGRTTDDMEILTFSTSETVMVGGGMECGLESYDDGMWPVWGNMRWIGGKNEQVNVAENQWDIADWPCFTKTLYRWDMPVISEGTQIVSATLTLGQFSEMGFEIGQSGDTTIQVFEVAQPWESNTISWDNLPPARENISWLTISSTPPECNRNCVPALQRVFDVTEAMRRAQAEGRTWSSVLMYTAAGQYHSGKYMWATGEVVVGIAPTE